MPRKILVSEALGAEAYPGPLPGRVVAPVIPVKRSLRSIAASCRESASLSARTLSDAVRLLFSR